jgi:hypothetical protein
MKKVFGTIALIPAVALLVFAGGCNPLGGSSSSSPSPDDDNGGMIFVDEICVNFSENRTSLEGGTVAVVDDFKAQVVAKLTEHGLLNGDDSDDDDVRIFMSGGRILLRGVYSGHDWDCTFNTCIERTDISHGPRELTRLATVTVPDDIAEPGWRPRFNRYGVRVVNRALADCLRSDDDDDSDDGSDPKLAITMKVTSSNPEPSPEDPLVFSWKACITVMTVVDDD